MLMGLQIYYLKYFKIIKYPKNENLIKTNYLRIYLSQMFSVAVHVLECFPEK